MNNIKEVKLFETFSGIGSQFKALKNLENENIIKLKSLGFVEWNIKTITAYHTLWYRKEDNASRKEMLEYFNKMSLSLNGDDLIKKNSLMNYKNEELKKYYKILTSLKNNDDKFLFWDNIKTLNKLPKGHDILTYSFPCQDLSKSGKRAGINEQTRSGLLWEIKRILLKNKDNLPKVLLLENVENLVSSVFINDFQKWIDFLNTLGYKTSYKVLNARRFGSAQNRKRVFAVSYLNKNIDFKWPKEQEEHEVINDILDPDYVLTEYDKKITEKYLNSENYTLSDWKTTKSKKRFKLINELIYNADKMILDPAYCGGVLMKRNGIKNKIFYNYNGNEIIRTISPSECFKYMGFSNEEFNKLKELKLFSNKDLIAFAGNSIENKTLTALMREIVEQLL